MKRIIGIGALLFLAGFAQATYGLTLYENKKPNAVIVIADDACPVVKFAAGEMKAYLKKAGDADIEIKTNILPEEKGVRIFIGESKYTKDLGVSGQGLKPEGFIIKTVNGSLVIIGQDDKTINPLAGGTSSMYRAKGTLNGVYDFLERYAGIRWYFPGTMGEVVPPLPVLKVADNINITDYPKFESRDLWPPSGLDLVAMGLKAEDITLWQLRNKYGGAYYFPCNHSVAGWAARFGKDHPTWFALKKDGTRDNDPNVKLPGNLCFSDPEVEKQFVKDAEDFFSGKATASIANGNASGDFFCIMPNDGYAGCECPRCQALYDKDTKWSELIWGLIAKVAVEVKKDYPNAKICCCAYSSYVSVPKTVKLPDNVYVRLTASSIYSKEGLVRPGKTASADKKEATPNADAGAYANQSKLLQDWIKAVNGRVYIWTYFNVRDACLPLGGCGMSPHYIAHLFQQYKGQVKGVFAEYSNWSYHQGESYKGEIYKGYGGINPSWMLDYVNIYVGQKALWNPDLDVDALLADHYQKMFGKGAPYMKQFYDELENIWLDDMLKRYLERKPINKYVLWEQIYTDQVMKRFEGYLDKAAEAATGMDRERVKFIKDWMYGEMVDRRNEYIAGKAESGRRKAYSRYIKDFGPLDGDKDKAVWKNAVAVGDFYNINGEKSKNETEVKLRWDNLNLYLLCICHEPRVNEVNTKNTAPLIWQNDGVEIFLAPAADYAKGNFYQIIVDADSKSMALKYVNGNSSAWVSGVKTAARRYKDLYAVEMQIPFANMVVKKPANGTAWRANFCRDRYLDSPVYAENSSWARLPYEFNQPDKFGRIFF